MNNTKRKILTGVIAALICFTMMMGSFGAILGAMIGLISNQDLIDAINNGSISVGDLALLASLQSGSIKINGQDVTNVSADGYHAKSNSNEVSDQKADYTKYNNPYYNPTDATTKATLSALQTSFAKEGYDTGMTSTAVSIGGVSFATTTYGAQSGAISIRADGHISENTLLYLANSTRVLKGEGTSFFQTTVDSGKHLVIAMATAEQIYQANAASSNDFRLTADATYGKHFAKDGIFDTGIVIIGYDENNEPIYEYRDIKDADVYGVCIKKTNFVIAKDASLTIVGRDLNGNGYIDDMPVGVNVAGDENPEWFYEKIVLSGSSAFQDYEVNDDSTIAGKYNAEKDIGGYEIKDVKDGVDRPLISVYGGPENTTCKLIISGADLRNNLNETIPDLTGKGTADIAKVDDVKAGGGAIYLASGSKTDTGRNETTCGYFSEVVITNTRFAYCGAVRGGAIMVGKNFSSEMLDISYCDFNHCYTTYFNYVGFSENDGIREGDQSGDGGAICFYQDDSLTEDWYTTKDHNNPSLIYVGTADFTGSTFKFCYAMRAGGAIFFGGYHYDNDDLKEDSVGGRITANHDSAENLGTRIGTLKLDFCDFYCCGAGWAMYGDPVDGSRKLVDADFIFKSDFVAPIDSNNRFYSVMKTLGITDIPAKADTDASEGLNANNGSTGSYLYKEAHCYSGYKDLVSFNWYRTYDCFQGQALQGPSAQYNQDVKQRSKNNWYNIPQLKFPEGSREGGAIYFNCRVKEMSMKDSTFVYCATDSNGSAVFLADYFVCPKATVENCLFKNCLSTQSFNGNATEGGTFRSRGLVAADIHFNNCSFLYNSNMSGAGALFMNLNHTYTGPNGDTTYNVKAPNNEDANGNAIRNGDGCAGTEVNNCVFFGNFSFWKGAAIKCSGVMDINSSTFAYNMVNAGSGGAIKFETYIRDGVNVGTSKAHMRFDINYGDGAFDGHTIVCNNAAGGNGDGNGGGGISINADHSESVGTPKTTVTSKDGQYTSNEYSFDFQLNGVLVFDNTAAGGGGGILYRVKSSAAPDGTTANAWLYNKSVILNDGYVFNNTAFSATDGGGGVRVRDNVSVREDSTKVSISGAYVYNNEAKANGGGLHIIAEGGEVNITGGYVIANIAKTGAGIYIKDTMKVNITGGHVGISKYGAPTITVGATDTTFADATTAALDGGNVASVNGGGIFIENSFTDETYFANDTTVTMKGGIIEANKATSYGGGLYMKRGTTADFGYVNFTMNPSANNSNSAYGFYGNTANNGAGIYADSNNVKDPAQRYVVNLNGGEVAANVAAQNGGGAFITAGAKLVVAGGTMDSNKANTQNGGAVYINSENAEAFISNGQISNNYAKVHGGGIQAYDAEVTVSGGKITANKADTAGGGLAIRNTALLTMNGGTVSSNTSVNGGGVFVSNKDAVANINGGTIGAGNTATNGGGIYVNDSATVTMTGGKVDGNTASTNGGGIYVIGTENFKMDGGAISNNTATSGNGGGIYIDGSGSTISQKVPKDAIKSDGTLDQSKLTLNVGIMTRSSWMTTDEATKAKTAFDNYIYNTLGLEKSLVKINYVVKDRDKDATNVNTTIKAIREGFNGATVHIILGGGQNIYDELAHTDFGYDNWPNITQIPTSNYTYRMDTGYCAADRFVSPLTTGLGNGKNVDSVYLANISDLTELCYRFFVHDSSSYKITDAIAKNLVGTYTIPGDPYKSTLASGNITGNKALNGYGGGFCCNASTVNLTANDNTSYPVINTNTAKNGGGVAVINGGSVTMQGGYVTGNTAKCVDANYVNTNTTSYQRHSNLEGVGGGIYVANELGSSSGTARFSIEDYNNFYSGIYLNNAEFAADDVFANAVNTQLSVPAFKSMHIMGDAGNVTGWFEDYAKGDVNYKIGLNGIRDLTGEEVLRYDFAAANGKNVFEAWIDKKPDDSTSTSNPMNFINEGNTFVCVTLGAYVVYDGNLTITKVVTGTAVDTEQVFLFHVKRILDQYENEVADVNIFVTINVNSSGNGSVTISSLPLGTYEVTEMTEWSWRYTIQSSKVEVANKSGKYAAATDKSGTTTDDTVGIDIDPIDADTGACNDPKITFTNKLTKTPWLDGNSKKVVNTAGATKATFGEVAYTNFKREETLI